MSLPRALSLSPLRPLLLSLQSAVNCFQLNCLPFSRHPFAARHRLFAPFNVARFRDSPNFPPAEKESEAAGGREKKSRLPRRRAPSRGERKKVSNVGEREEDLRVEIFAHGKFLRRIVRKKESFAK